MDERALGTGVGRFYEGEDLVSSAVLRVHDRLLVAIGPEVCQIVDCDWLPMIRYLSSCAINDVGDLVGHNELEVLQRVRMGRLPVRRTRRR